VNDELERMWKNVNLVC